jgi:hypothetical protein
MTMEPTPKLRFVERATSLDAENCATHRVLQQWWAEPMPAYMRSEAVGEWRDVPVSLEIAQ